MRSTDTGPAPPKAAEKRKANSRQRAIASAVIMVAALIFVFVRDEATLGFTVALVAAGVISVDNVKAWFG